MRFSLFLPVLAVIFLNACASGSADRPTGNIRTEAPPDRPTTILPPKETYTDISRDRPSPALEARLDELWRSFPGKTGIAVRRIDGDWTIGHRGDQYFPQQSVSKLWVALTLLDRIDRGEAALSDSISIGPNELTLFHQPIAAEVARNGTVTKSVYSLLEQALASSDNTANDALLNHAGGPEAVRAFIAKHGLGKIRFGPGERLLQSGIAGMDWNQGLSQGRRFYSARAQVPVETRRQSLYAYLADPIDGASPFAIVGALDKLARGELLAPESTRLVQDILSRTRSGPNRLKAGVPTGWKFLHKTGTGQVLGSVATGYNDVGIMEAPDGTRYAVAVMLADTTASIPRRMEMMQAVTRAVAQYHKR